MNEKPHKDIAITGILACIWFGAVSVILLTRDDIPLYLLGIATVFFLMLVPAMKELVRSLAHRPNGNRASNRSTVDE